MKAKIYTQKVFVLLTALLFLSMLTNAQDATITGFVQDDQETLVGASVVAMGTEIGTVTDIEGQYMLTLGAGTYDIKASFVGYTSESKSVTLSAGESLVVNFILLEGLLADIVIVTGTRAPNRTNTDAAVPIDVIRIDQLTAAAPQTNLNQMLHYTAPSFSSNTQTISDGTDHIDPASLRGLGPDQVLVLINGKRRHTSSLVNVNGTFGRGSVGTDLNSMPAAAISSIEILRDGAAAQYGSDAIAGVINMRLQDAVNELKVNITTGANFTKNASPQKDIDGEVAEIGVNYGLPLGNSGGFINLTGAFNYRGWTSRMQEFSGDIFNGYNAVEWVASQAGADLSTLTMADIQSYAQNVGHFTQQQKDEIAVAPDLVSLQGLLGGDVTDAELDARGMTRSDFNMRVGQSENRGGKFFGNMSLPVGENMEVYAFGGMSYRDGESGCFYRLPNQNRTYTPTYLNGFIPKINSNILDKSMSTGLAGQIDDWDVDLSYTYGTNQFLFHMTESHNATLGSGSPTEFDAGGHSFAQNTGNLDIGQYFDNMNSIAGINLAFGAEYRYENFKVIPGSELSYGNYDANGILVNSITQNNDLVVDFLGRGRPSGAQCFAGFLPSNEVDANRSSAAAYADAEFDISQAFLLGAAVRFENYNDFGSTFNYKASGRYKVNNNFVVRAATSTGFRAPSLHQIHFSRTSTIFVTEGGVTTAQEVGVFANTSRVAELLGIPSLKEETSQNYSAGFTAKLPSAGLKFTIDGYLVNIDDRVVLTGQFAPGTDTELLSLFNQAQATRAAFFANAIDTRSSGIDVVVAHRVGIGEDAMLSNDLAATFTRTEQVGDIKASDLLESKGLVDTYFDETARIYLEEAVPRVKLTLSHMLDLNKVQIYLRNTYFGETTEATNISSLDPSVDYINDGKVITDLSIGYQFTDNLRVTIGSNNLLDVYPDEVDETFISSGRFVYSRRSPQFSYGGRHLFGRLSFTLK